MTDTPNHNYNVPNEGRSDWHIPLNENFEQYDTDIEIRDQEANRSDYTPKDGAKFLATDTGQVYLGDGASWNRLETTGEKPSHRATVYRPRGQLTSADLEDGEVMVYVSDGSDRFERGDLIYAINLRGSIRTHAIARKSDTQPAGTIVAEDFESHHGMSRFKKRTFNSSVYDFGIRTSAAPDGGDYHGYLMENTNARKAKVGAQSPETPSWDQSYEFDFLVRCSDYNPNEQTNFANIWWRTKVGENTGDGLGVRMFSTDSAGNPQPFVLRGRGVQSSDNTYDITWRESVWYRVKGEIDEQDGMGRAKIWTENQTEPATYQIEVPVSTGISEPYPYTFVVSGRDGNSKMTFDIAHARWVSV